MEDLKLSEATEYLIEDLMNECAISRAKARKLLANVLFRNIVIAEIKNEADYVLKEA